MYTAIVIIDEVWARAKKNIIGKVPEKAASVQ